LKTPAFFWKKEKDEITKKDKHEITKWKRKTCIKALGANGKCANLLVVNLEFVL